MLHKLRGLISLAMAMSVALSSAAQKVELGAMIGLGNYFGDLAPTPVISETKPAGGIFARYNFSSSFALTGSLNATMISGSDKNFDFNQARNLNFRSMIYEYATVLEFNFLKYGVGVLDNKFTSYAFVGVSLFRFNPQTQYAGQWIDLNVVQTEDVKYNLTSVAIPFGMGIKLRLNRNFSFEGNLGLRMTYTDYLDDVSATYPDPVKRSEQKGYVAAVLSDRSAEKNNGIFQNKEGYRRGNQDFQDWYIIGGIGLSYRIYSKVRCSRFY